MKWAFFTSLGLFFSNFHNSIGGSKPFETLGIPTPPPLESFLQPWRDHVHLQIIYLNHFIIL